MWRLQGRRFLGTHLHTGFRFLHNRFFLLSTMLGSPPFLNKAMKSTSRRLPRPPEPVPNISAVVQYASDLGRVHFHKMDRCGRCSGCEGEFIGYED